METRSDTYAARLEIAEGLIEYPAGRTIALTTAGQAHASTAGVPSTTEGVARGHPREAPAGEVEGPRSALDVYREPLERDTLYNVLHRAGGRLSAAAARHVESRLILPSVVVRN